MLYLFLPKREKMQFDQINLICKPYCQSQFAQIQLCYNTIAYCRIIVICSNPTMLYSDI